MKLTYKNYIAKSDGDRFNLTQIKHLTAKEDGKKYKKGEKYTTEVLIGYGYYFENLLKKIITLELSNGENTLSIAEYIDEYKSLLEQIKTALK